MAKVKNVNVDVPMSEQPYALPEGWRWVIGKECLLPMVSKRPSGDVFRYIDIDAIDNGLQTVSTPKILKSELAPSRACRELMTNDTLFSLVRPYLRNIAYIHEELADCIASTGFYVCRPSAQLYGKYLYYYMTSDYCVEELTKHMKGDNSPSIKKEYIDNFFYPIPQLLTQHRIVSRIESLFTKLDRAKELVQSVLDSFETRKASVLHMAFTGELTREWRRVNGVGEDSWVNKTVSETCLAIKVGIVIRPSQYYTEKEGVPAFRSANVRECRIDNNDWVYLNDEGYYINKRSIVHKDDVLVVRSGNPGTACVVTDEYDGYNAIDIIIAVPNMHKILPDFLCLYTNSPAGKELIQGRKRGMALTHLNVHVYSALPIKLPSLPEQQEIVRILDALFEKEQRARELCDVIDRIDAMKKAILGKAFRGLL